MNVNLADTLSNINQIAVFVSQNWLTIVFGIFAIIGVFYTYLSWKNNKRQEKISQNQLFLSVEPKLKLDIHMANMNPIVLECQNTGAGVEDAQFFVDGQYRDNIYFKEERKMQGFRASIELPLLFVQGKETVQLTIKYVDKLNRQGYKIFIFHVQDKKIIPT
jgi:hypothetical protein